MSAVAAGGGPKSYVTVKARWFAVSSAMVPAPLGLLPELFPRARGSHLRRDGNSGKEHKEKRRGKSAQAGTSFR